MLLLWEFNSQKNGKKNGKQRYKCYGCQKQFLVTKRVDPFVLWNSYIKGKQTYVQLAEKYKCSVRTIQRKIDEYQVKKVPNNSSTDGFIVQAIVWDGRKGLIKSFDPIPVQMCVFHQAAIIRRYLTKRPKMQASIELKAVVDLMTRTDKESFVGVLADWVTKWESFLNERSKTIETIPTKS